MNPISFIDSNSKEFDGGTAGLERDNYWDK